MQFTGWTVKSHLGLMSKATSHWWLCRCVCGVERSVNGCELKRGKTKSCGCLWKKAMSIRRTSHGHTKGGPSRTYRTWQAMVNRCYRAKDKCFHLYGGRGVKVCERWLIFANFLEDMGERPNGLTIDRKDNNGNYSKENCKWSTASQQNSNRRAFSIRRSGRLIQIPAGTPK